MLEVVLAVQLPVLSDHNPPTTIPSLEEAQTIQMTANTLGLAVEPTTWFIVVVALVQVPVRAHMSPVLVPEAAKDAPTVAVDPDALELAPEPPELSMKLVSVVVFAPELPILAFYNPTGTSPATQHTLAVQVVANTLESTPTPFRLLVVVVAPPKVPV